MKMKIIILVVINLVATICSQSTDSGLVSFKMKIDTLKSSSEPIDSRLVTLAMKIDQLKFIYLNKCVRNLDLTQQKELEIAHTSFIKCSRFEILFESDKKDFCSNYEQYGTCLQNFAKIANGCLDKNEKYLPDFLLNADQRLLNRFCKGNELDHINTLIDNCNLRLGDLIFCVLKLNMFNNLDSKDYSLNRIDVCSDLKTLQKCSIKIFQTNCGITKEDIDLLNSMYEDYQKECSLANTNMSNFVVLTLLVIISKLSQ